MNPKILIFIFALGFFGFKEPFAAGAAVPVTLARHNKARMPIVVPDSASPALAAVADTLAAYLSHITGAAFVVKPGDGKTGIAIGAKGKFKGADSMVSRLEDGITHGDDYLLYSHPKGLYIIGNTDLAVEHGVWDLLYRIGYRRYFPGREWEIIPKIQRLRIKVDVLEKPSFYTRNIFYGWGTWGPNAQLSKEWRDRNRLTSAFVLETGHAYGGIVSKYKATFAEHPEYLALVNGKRTSDKLCISNQGLRDIVTDYALDYFKSHPKETCISMEPSDGNGWCECDSCKQMGSPSDRAIFLANEVADTVNKVYGEKFVGMYAYNQHSPPPDVRVHPNVIVSVATAFNRSGLPIDSLMRGWKKQGAVLGVRDYLSVNVWDRDGPGVAIAGSPGRVDSNIVRFYNNGARYYTAECGDNWGPYGLGYYMAGRTLWDIHEAARTDSIVNEFLANCFENVQEPMRRFYALIDGRNRPLQLQTNVMVSRMYGPLKEALTGASSPAVRTRIHDLILYTHYLELYKLYADSRGTGRQSAFEELLKYSSRIRNSEMIHTWGLGRDLPMRDKTVTLAPELQVTSSPAKNPWLQAPPFTEAEIEAFLK